jgi:hypothetical protein
MKTFFQWAEERKHDLSSILVDVKPNDGKKQDENGRRTALNPLLPVGYGRNQLPEAGFAGRKATWKLDWENAKKYGDKVRKDTGGTPLPGA